MSTELVSKLPWKAPRAIHIPMTRTLTGTTTTPPARMSPEIHPHINPIRETVPQNLPETLPTWFTTHTPGTSTITTTPNGATVHNEGPGHQTPGPGEYIPGSPGYLTTVGFTTTYTETTKAGAHIQVTSQGAPTS